MEEDIVLKIKEKEAYQVIKYIAIIYMIFLFFLALILGYEETIIQVAIMVVFVAVIDAINCGELTVTEKGIKSKGIGFIRYNQIYRLNLNNKILTVYTRDSIKPFKIIIAMGEDSKLVEKAYRFMNAKVKRIEEDTKEHEEYVKKYLQ